MEVGIVCADSLRLYYLANGADDSHEDKYLVLLAESAYTIETAIRASAEMFEAQKLFYGHGTDTAIDEATWLVLHALGLSPAIAPDYARQLTRSELEKCDEFLERRIEERKPSAYITGHAWFAGHQFFADERALVPRSPLAEFITDDFFGLLEGQEAPRILDLCTGGGCIAIACAYAREQSQIDASDLSAEALALAQQNILLHGMQDRVQLLEGSLFEPVRERYSLIISNPPYVDAADIDAMPAEFAHEPLMGLAAGEDGLDLVRVMLREAIHYLESDGYLVVEVGNSGATLENAFPDVPFGWLQFSQGGHGVFVLDYQMLSDAQSSLV